MPRPIPYAVANYEKLVAGDYHFVDKERFDEMVADGEFAEWALVHDNHYGTSKKAVDRALSEGYDVVFDVDFQGGRTLQNKWPDDALMIFILPPDWNTLEDRLRRRATDSARVIERRLAKARDELQYHKDYKHRIVNREIDEAYQSLRAIYRGRKLGGDALDARERELVAESEGDEECGTAERCERAARAPLARAAWSIAPRHGRSRRGGGSCRSPCSRPGSRRR